MRELLELSCCHSCSFSSTAAAKCFAGLLNKHPAGTAMGLGQEPPRAPADKQVCQAPVADACNPSYSGGRYQDHKTVSRKYPDIPSKTEALSSNLSVILVTQEADIRITRPYLENTQIYLARLRP
jgi:hypothetical protein